MWQYNYIYQELSNDELMHYGVMGMRWGVRRYRNKDGSLTERGKKYYAEKGATITKAGKGWSHMSKEEEVKLKNSRYNFSQNTAQKLLTYALGVPVFSINREKGVLYAYDKNNKHDADVYQGLYTKFITDGYDIVKTYKHDFITKYDTISPSRKERVDTFIETYSKNKGLYSSVVKANDKVLEALKDKPGYGYIVERYYTGLDKKRLKEDKYIRDNAEKLYESFVQSQVQKGGIRGKANTKYFDALLDKGYDSLIDDHNIDIYNKAETPTIFLNPKNTLEKTNVRVVSQEERDKAYKRMEKDAKKRNYVLGI